MPPGRRNVRKLALRPPLPRRSIVWFPAFPSDAPIETFRRQHDALAAALPAHVTLVFPFPTNFTATQIASHVRRVVANWPTLPVSFRDVDVILEEYVVLMLRERSDAITALHDKLYGGILSRHLRADIDYQPHVALGRLSGNPSHADFASMYRAAVREVRGEWRCILRELAIVTWHPDGKISIDKTVPLNFA